MVKHPDHVKGFEGTLDELARNIGNMTYDKTAEFIESLADDLRRQGDTYTKRGEAQLAYPVENSAALLYQAKEEIENAWKICKPYMEEQIRKKRKTKHLDYIEEYEGTLEDLAKDIGNITEGITAIFIGYLADDLRRQGDADTKRGYVQLVARLYDAAEILYKAKDEIEKVKEIER